MKLYAIKDRMLGYFLTPFAAPNDNDVLSNLSLSVSTPNPNSAITIAPHHFELYQLGIINDDGSIISELTFICDCGTLVRVGRQSTEPKTQSAETPARYTPSRLNGAGSNADPGTGAV